MKNWNVKVKITIWYLLLMSLMAVLLLAFMVLVSGSVSSQTAMDLGLDGLMIESHCDPTCALSDAKQQLTPKELSDLMDRIVVRESDSDSPEYKENIHQLRAKIDVIDDSLLYMLGSRMAVSRQIGEYKKHNNIAILQTGRWDELLEKAIAKGAELGLPAKFVSTVFNAIHDASVQVQNEILTEDSSNDSGK